MQQDPVLCRIADLDLVKLTAGASPPEKHETTLQRMASQVSTARVFYSLSASTRSSPTFSNKGDTILPPFCRGAFAAALSNLDVRMHFVPRGEADGVCVVLADQMGGYVLGRDTDFVILSAGASDKLRGYAPLDMMEWTDSAPPEDTAPAADFTTVAAKRPRSARSRLLPPSGAGNATLVLATYATTPLCRRLRLDAPMLPLLSSLVGNDYTPAWAGDALFPRMRPGDRIERVARVLAELRPGVSSADELVRRAVKRLWARPFVDDAAAAELTDAVIDATIQYVLPAPDCCAQFPFCGELDAGCRTATASRGTSAAPSRAPTPAASASAEHGEHPPAVVAYAAAQRSGRLNALTAAYLHPDRVHLWSALEDPSTASCRAGAAACRARLAAYTILDGAVGGLRFPPASAELLEEQRQDQEANALLGIEAEEEPREERPRVVTEFMRQGGGRIVARRAVLPPKEEASDAGDASDASTEHGEANGGGGNGHARLNGEAGEGERTPASSGADGVPECLLPLAERQRLYLHHLGADTPAILALPARLHPLVAAVRLLLSSGGDWTRAEIEALLRGCIGSLAAWDAVAASDSRSGRASDAADAADTTDAGEATDSAYVTANEEPEPESERAASPGLERIASGVSQAFEPEAAPAAVELSSRATRLVAALTSALQDSQPLAQALLLPAPHGSPHVWVAGAALHALLGGKDPAPGAGWAWDRAAKNSWKRSIAATLEGHDLPAAPAENKKTRKKNKNRRKAAEGKTKAAKDKGPANRFDLLVGM